MPIESKRGNEKLLQNIHCIVVAAIDSLQEEIQFRAQDELVAENNRKVLDFQTLLELTISAMRLNHEPGFWRNKVISVFNTLTQQLSSDVGMMFELRSHWSRYLVETGQHQVAVAVGTQILQASLPKDIDPQLRNQLVVHKFSSLVGIAHQLFNHDQVELAFLLLSKVPLYLQGSFVDTTIRYYKQQSNSVALLQLIGQMQTESEKLADGNGDKKSQFRQIKKNFLRQKIEQAHNAWLELAGQVEPVQNGLEVITRIQTALSKKNDLEARTQLHLLMLEKQFGIIRIVVGQLFSERHDEVVIMTFSQLIAILAASNSTESDAVELLFDLLEGMFNIALLKPMAQELIIGTQSLPSLAQLIMSAGVHSQPQLWSRMMVLVSRSGDVEDLPNLYQRGKVKFSDHQDQMRVAYALCLFQSDQEAAVQSLSELRDKGYVAEQLKWFLKQVFPSVSFYQFRPWLEVFTVLDQKAANFYYDVPGVVLMPTRDPGEMVPSNYQLQLPFLLADLALLALKNGKWGVFRQLMDDPRMAKESKVRVIKEAGQWLLSAE